MIMKIKKWKTAQKHCYSALNNLSTKVTFNFQIYVNAVKMELMGIGSVVINIKD